MVYRVNPNFESDAKLTSIVRRLKALELSKRTQSSAPELSKLVVSPVCVLCNSQAHLVEQCPVSKRSKQMSSIHFASLIPTTTHLVKHTIRDSRIIPTFPGSLIKDKDMVNHHHFKDHLQIINFTREINSIQHHLSLHMFLPIKKTIFRRLSNNSCRANS